MAQWVGVQGQVKVAKKEPKHPHLWQSPQRTLNRKRKTFFFSISSRRLAESVDGLDSSLAQSPGELWICKGRVKKLARAGLKGLDKKSQTLSHTHTPICNDGASFFINTIHLLPKQLRFKHGGAKPRAPSNLEKPLGCAKIPSLVLPLGLTFFRSLPKIDDHR